MNKIIGKSLFSHFSKLGGGKSEFASIQKEYSKFKKNAAKSDLASSVTYAQKEIEILSRLIEAAQKEGKTDNIQEFVKRLEELQKTINEAKPLEFSYYRPVFHQDVQTEEEATTIEPDASEIDINEEDISDKEATPEELRIITAFKKEGNYHISQLIKKCKSKSGNISASILEAVERLASTDTNPNTVINFIEEFATNDSDSESEKTIDLSLCDKFQKMQAEGFNDIDSLIMLKYINHGNFLEPEIIQNSAIRMHKNNIPTNIIINIMDILSMNDINNKVKVSESALSDVRVLKRNLFASSVRNDLKERFCPINKNKKEEVIVGPDRTKYIYNNGKLEQVIPPPDEELTVDELRKQYKDMLSEKENNILVDFTKEYKTKDGNINPEAMRTITSLLRYGVTIDDLLDLTRFCMQNGNVNTDKLNLVSELKSAGAVSKDIKDIINAITVDEQGKYNSEDRKNACDLTSATLGGKEVVSLLPDVRGNKDVKEIIMFLAKNPEAGEFVDSVAEIIKDKSNISHLTSMIKKDDGTVDETAVEMLEKLVQHYSDNESTIDENSFVEVAEAIITAAYNETTHCLDEEAAGISAIMLSNNETFEHIIEGINICKDNYGVINSNLAEILWDLSLDKTSFEDIKTVVKACKSRNGTVNNIFAQTILSMFEHGDKSDKIIEMIKKSS